jgi:hypothetical protein
MDRTTGIVLGVIALLVLCVCCLALCIVAFAGAFFIAAVPTSGPYPTLSPYGGTPTPVVIRPTAPIDRFTYPPTHADRP